MRGNVAPNGATRVAQNEYHYTKQDGKWRLTHHIIAEEILGRPLNEYDRVRFRDGDRKNLSRENIEVVAKGSTSLRQKRARLTARIEELQAQVREIDDQLQHS